MGKRIAHLALKDPDIRIVAAADRPGCPDKGKDLGTVLGVDDIGVKIAEGLREVGTEIDSVIDFTLAAPAMENLAICRDRGIPVVLGTTGFDSAQVETIKETAKDIAVVFSPNMAPGVNLLFSIVSQAATALGVDFGIKIDETHHVHKKDAPSGTAAKIAEVIESSCGKKVPIESIREGEVVGEHGIIFQSDFEKLEIRHEALTRDVFAQGALKAARFLSGRGPGLFDMHDVLGISK
jgi:4-hydroxy-tetrahydrodipicolinate reductase